MFIVGTLSRATAGTLATNVLFIVVAMSGAMFGRSMGGGIGTVLIALACAAVSKQALERHEASFDSQECCTDYWFMVRYLI